MDTFSGIGLKYRYNTFLATVILAVAALALSACGGGGSATSTATTAATENPTNESASNADSSAEFNSRLLLSWNPPESRENQTSLEMSDIKGYRIYYRNLSENSDEFVVDFADNNTSEYAIAVNAAGTYSFEMTVYDWNDLESQRSNTVTVEVN